MSLQKTLKRVFNIGSYTHEDVEKTDNLTSLEKENGKEDETISEQVGQSSLFIRGNFKEGYFLVLGNYKVTRKIQYLWKAREIAEQTDWETIMNVCAVMIEVAFKIKDSKDLDGSPT